MAQMLPDPELSGERVVFLSLALPGGGQVPPPDLPLVTIKFGQLFETFVWNKNRPSALSNYFAHYTNFELIKSNLIRDWAKYFNTINNMAALQH